MTHDSVTNFAASLVEMARSHEKVPLLEEHVRNLETALAERDDRVQKLELRIIDLKADQDALYAKLRSVEAERDEASFRLLESEDKIAAFTRLVGDCAAALGKVLSDPPEVAKAPLSDIAIAPSESSLLQAAEVPPTGSIELRAESGEGPTSPNTTAADHGIGTSHATQDGEFPTGQSDPRPTVASDIEGSIATTQIAAVSNDVGSQTIGDARDDLSTLARATSASQIADDERIHGPYYGKRYYDHPSYVTLIEWLNGGGTEADYHWRPGAQFSSASHYS